MPLTPAKGRESYPPLCVGACDLLADDILRLLFYQRFIPRSVLVDYLKILLSFHLGLYHLRLPQDASFFGEGKELPIWGAARVPAVSKPRMARPFRRIVHIVLASSLDVD